MDFVFEIFHQIFHQTMSDDAAEKHDEKTMANYIIAKRILYEQ